MDELDQKLLHELQKQGFENSRTLASLLGVGERTVHRRISAMRREGIIKIIALPDFVLFGYKAWAKIGIRVKPQSLSYVASQLANNPSIYFVAYAYGPFDIMIAVHFYNIDSLTIFINSELTKIKGILNTETMVLTSPRKYYNFSWPRASFKKIRNGLGYDFDAGTNGNHYEIDKADQRILSILMEDGLARPADMKSRLGIGESTIRKRIKKMSSNGVFRMVVVPNPEILEHEVWATMGITIENRLAHEVLDSIIKHPEVYLASVAVGRFNLVIAARFHHIDFINQFVNIKLPAIKGVSYVETFVHNKPLKYHNIHWPI
ncbi:MAG: Lrp/AsnC family transcriptional regulator [Deltaproteobacteria bacterium]|nr:Lrp/AsnC family transcriptional regulator [Deltaproteobacteria bacterium]